MASRDLEEARKAFTAGDIQQSKSAYQVKNQEKHLNSGEWIKSAVYSGLDGILTIFAIASAAFGSGQSSEVVLILGLSSLFGDAISMAIGDYLGTKSEIEFAKAERMREEWEVANNPKGEREELKEIYIEKGLDEEDALLVVETLSKTPKVWVDIMMIEELGIIESNESPWKNALVSFISFILLGQFSLLPYIIAIACSMHNEKEYTFYSSLTLTIMTMFSIGAIKTKFTGKNLFISGLETLIIGGIAASIAYFIGWVLDTNSQSII